MKKSTKQKLVNAAKAAGGLALAGAAAWGMTRGLPTEAGVPIISTGLHTFSSGFNNISVNDDSERPSRHAHAVRDWHNHAVDLNRNTQQLIERNGAWDFDPTPVREHFEGWEPHQRLVPIAEAPPPDAFEQEFGFF